MVSAAADVVEAASAAAVMGASLAARRKDVGVVAVALGGPVYLAAFPV